MNLSFLAASAVAAMVITGSLVAGDSLKGSIVSAVYENLGEVDEVVVSEQLFRQGIVDELEANKSLTQVVDHVAPLLFLDGVVENPKYGERTGKARIIGFDERFLEFGGR